MGAVHQARDLETGQAVAIKTIRDPDEHSIERFLREARILATLSHPAVVRYVAHGRTDGELFLAMEWLEGESLGHRLARDGLTPRESLALGVALAEALGAAHARGVVHRDVKPGNVFLVDGAIERLKLLDFGVARLRVQAHELTRTGFMVGTPGYMSPEQARGAREIGPAADVFALGCVLFKCLTGRVAFDGDDALARIVKAVLVEAPRVRSVRPDVPEALDELVHQMLAKTPEDRPADAAAVVAALRAIDLAGADDTTMPSVGAPALTTSEQRLVSVVLLGGVATASAARPVVRAVPEADATVGALESTTVLGALADAAVAYGGRLDALLEGSAVVTLFGVGTAVDQAGRAAACALALREIAPAAPMALATGRVDVSGRRPVGDAIDRAARLLGADERPTVANGPIDVVPVQPVTATRPIRVDDVTAGLLGVRYDVATDAGDLVLRGRRLHDAARTLLGRPTPCVGRETELGLIDALFAQCAAEGVARAAVVIAPPGVGKSRVRYEFVRKLAARAEPVELWLARGDPMSAGSAFGLASQIVRGAAGLLDGEPAAVRQQKLVARVGRHVPRADVARVAEFLGELVGAAFPDDDRVQLHSARQEPMLMGDQMRRAWHDFLAAECAAQPVVVVLEDLHWGDLPTVRLLDASLRLLAESPLMVVAFARPEIDDLFPDLWAARGAQTIRLGALTRKACERLVRAVLGDAATPAVIQRVVDQSAGNAFYLEESLRAVAAGHGDKLPETVLAMVEARLAAMDPALRRVLRAASVFGQVFWRQGVAALLGGEVHTLETRAWLEDLTARELVAPRDASRFADADEFAFRHAFVRETAYATLTPADRALGHRLAAEYLEHAGETNHMLLAEHYERGGEPAQAVGHYARAADQALEGNDFAAVFERAARAVRCGAAGEVLGALRRTEAEAHRWRGENAAAEARAAEAMALARRGSTAWCAAAAEASSTAMRVGNVARLAAIAEELTALEPGDRELPMYGIAAARVARGLYLKGQADDADALVARADAVAQRRADPMLVGMICDARACRAGFAGDPVEMLKYFTRAADVYETAGHARYACGTRAAQGFSFNELGAYAEAERVLVESRAVADQLGLMTVAATATHNLGWAVAMQGRDEEAKQLEITAIAALKAQGNNRTAGASYVFLAAILVRQGDRAAALHATSEALALLDRGSALYSFALAMRAHVLLADAQHAEALAAAREAADTLTVLGGGEGGEALIRLVLAEALHATGDVPSARAAIASARDRLHERADKVTDAAWRRSFLEAVPENARTLALAAAWLAAAPADARSA